MDRELQKRIEALLDYKDRYAFQRFVAAARLLAQAADGIVAGAGDFRDVGPTVEVDHADMVYLREYVLSQALRQFMPGGNNAL